METNLRGPELERKTEWATHFAAPGSVGGPIAPGQPYVPGPNVKLSQRAPSHERGGSSQNGVSLLDSEKTIAAETSEPRRARI